MSYKSCGFLVFVKKTVHNIKNEKYNVSKDWNGRCETYGSC